MTLSTITLIERNPELWAAATHHSFLDQVRDGQLPEEAFARWLEQDYLFVVGLTRAWGRLLENAPIDDLGLLAGGIAAFTDELAWFEGLACSHDVRLDAEPMPVARDYIDYLAEVAGAPYPVAITAMWAVEAVYLRAWQEAQGGSTRHAELVNHWANDDFSQFVDKLAVVADRELGAAPELHAKAQNAFASVAKHEAAFWGIGKTAPN